MRKHLTSTLATIICFFIQNFASAQTTKIRSNKEISMEVSVNSENKALLKWISQSDHQTSHFIVQRSKDNETFFDIREIEVKKRAIEAGQQLQFAFTDSKFLRTTEYYRIMEYEFGGESHIYTSILLKPKSPVSIMKNGFVRVTVEDGTNVTVLISTKTGLGIPCEFSVLENNDVILIPAYVLNGGNYLVKLSSLTGEKQF